MVDAGDESLGISPLTLAEVLVGPARLHRLPKAEAALRDLEIATVGLTASARVRLATLRADTRLRLPIVVSCWRPRLRERPSPPLTAASP